MLAAAALSLVAGPAKANPAEIQIVTQSFAPLQWDNAGKPDGYVTAYMLEVARRVGETIPLKIGAYEFLPWKRAMLLAETMPNVLFFSLSRTPEREDKFIWLGEVSPYGQNFYQLSTRPRIEADTVEDLRDQKVRIGVQDGSNLLSHLKQLGFEKTGNLMPITDFHQGIEMLYLERIDVLPLTGFLAEASAASRDMTAACCSRWSLSKHLPTAVGRVQQGTDPALVEAFRQEMTALKDSGFLDAQTRQHQVNWQTLACGALTAGK